MKGRDARLAEENAQLRAEVSQLNAKVATLEAQLAELMNLDKRQHIRGPCASCGRPVPIADESQGPVFPKELFWLIAQHLDHQEPKHLQIWPGRRGTCTSCSFLVFTKSSQWHRFLRPGKADSNISCATVAPHLECLLWLPDSSGYKDWT